MSQRTINDTLNPLPKNSKLEFGKPETQIFAAIQLVGAAEDPLSTDPNKRNDKVHEVCQFCVRVPEQFTGNLHVEAVNKAFEHLKLSCIDRMRKAGILKAGE